MKKYGLVNFKINGEILNGLAFLYLTFIYRNNKVRNFRSTIAYMLISNIYVIP